MTHESTLLAKCRLIYFSYMLFKALSAIMALLVCCCVRDKHPILISSYVTVVLIVDVTICGDSNPPTPTRPSFSVTVGARKHGSDPLGFRRRARDCVLRVKHKKCPLGVCLVTE